MRVPSLLLVTIVVGMIARAARADDRLDAEYLRAIEAHDWAKAQAALERGVAVDVTHMNGDTALTSAISRGDLEALRWLLQHGANVNRSDASGDTPLIRATQRSEYIAEAGVTEALIEELLTRGADVRAAGDRAL